MPDEFVALDLETTGLSVETDQITEVGATRFDRSGRRETFATFVNPGRPIPREIQELTGITDADVADAPRFHEIADELREFIGERPIVGQNIAFDIAFLAAEQVVSQAQAFDTWELASVILPTAERLNLETLAGLLDVPMPVAHRALSDAEATRDVFLALLDRLDAMPRTLLLELRAFAERASWSFVALIDDALRRGSDGPVDEAAAREVLASLPVRGPRIEIAPLEPSDELAPVTAEDINALFRAAADHTVLFPSYERRSGQEQMAHVVAEHLAQGGHLAVEAGTGTGKSLAYLLPSLLHALRNDDRVVVSTHTLNLQDQLAEKDMPVARTLVEAHEGAGELRTTVLKGRNNYLCLERWAQVRMDPSPRTEPEGRLFARISAWLPQTETGDLGELYMTSQDRPAWDLVSAEDTDCLQRRCPYVRDGSCFLLRARQRAAAAHVVIVNHSLLLANAARDDQVLPGFRHLVIDEAHRLEDVATQHYGASVSVRDLRDLIDLIAGSGERRGGGFSIARRLQGLDGSAEALSPVAGLRGLAERLAQPYEEARERVRDLGDAGRRFIEEHGDESGRGRREVSLTASRRAQPAWEDVEEAALQVDLALHVLEERLRPVRDALVALGEERGVEGLRAEAGHALEAIAGARETLRRGVLRPSADDIGWLAGWEGDVRLHLAPLMVSELLATDLYAERESVAVTSATLTTAGSFDFTISRLGLDHPRTLEIPSPYDYRRAVLALIAEDLPEPGMPGYDRAVHDTLIEATIATGGRTLALFTSHAAVRAAAQAVRDALHEQDILVLAQGVDGSPARLLRLLMERPRSLLIGTAAFWEGVDVQGEALSQIVMARLPFPVPSDPIYAGRSEQYDDPFQEYAVPQAILRFRQGFGRLIRGAQDRGAFLVLDSRVSRRRYGELFLDALPDCEVRHLRADDIAMAVDRWLA